jgi:AraC family transcriptional regulator
MSIAQNRTSELWRSFMPRRNEIRNRIGTDLYSVQFYDPSYFTAYNPHLEFEKWASVKVSDFNSVPENMEPLVIPRGSYAVFVYQGPPSQGAKFFEYIFATWLPQSGYRIDNRPHFEILGDRYKGEDLESEEEIWIPIRQ